MINGIYILKEGETPWSYRNNPGYFEGPFVNREEAFECLDLDGDLEVVEYWDRGNNGLWVITKAVDKNSELMDAYDKWWEWHDDDQGRWSSSFEEAERRCLAWVRGESDDGPERV